MKYQLSFTFLISIYPILVGGNTYKTPELSQPNIIQKTKKPSVSKSIPLKKINRKNKKEESKTLTVRTALKKFVLTYNKNRVAIKGYQMDLKFR